MLRDKVRPLNPRYPPNRDDSDDHESSQDRDKGYLTSGEGLSRALVRIPGWNIPSGRAGTTLLVKLDQPLGEPATV
jgi:hypothetical protein